MECLNNDGTQTDSLSDKAVTLTSGEEVLNSVFMRFEYLFFLNYESDLNIFKMS